MQYMNSKETVRINIKNSLPIHTAHITYTGMCERRSDYLKGEDNKGEETQNRFFTLWLKALFKCSFVFIFKKNIYGRTNLSRVTKNFQPTTEFCFLFCFVFFLCEKSIWSPDPSALSGNSGILFQIEMPLSSSTSFLQKYVMFVCGGLSEFRKEGMVVYFPCIFRNAVIIHRLPF